MLKRTRLSVLLLLLVVLPSAAMTQLKKPRMTVLVLGTIHQRHGTNANYPYADVVRFLSAFDPDLICVEIRPRDFGGCPTSKK